MAPSTNPNPQHKNQKPATPRTAQVLKPPAHLPRELIDLIISTYISQFNHDPAYQWMHLRHITRYHQRDMERQFLNFWVPNLKMTLYDDENAILQFGARSVSKKSGIVRFKAHSGRLSESQNWEELVYYTSCIAVREISRDRNLTLELGEGILNKGYSGGGIVSDMRIPNLTVDAKAGDICFDWKLLFTHLFREELVMRRMRDNILEDFLPTLAPTRKEQRLAHMKTPKYRNQRILSHLRKTYRIDRRMLLIDRFRDHLIYKEGPFRVPSSQNSMSFYDHFFFMETVPILEKIERESMVFHIPGWESWNIRDVAHLRAEEEISRHNHYRCEMAIGQSTTRHMDFWEERWDVMLGKKRVSEKALETYLKSACFE